MIEPRKVCLYIPDGLKKFKLDLFERIGRRIEAAGGILVRGSRETLAALPSDVIPVVGCSPELRDLIGKWRATGRAWIYWDRGYARRVFATWLPRGENGGYYRWHVGSYQLQRVHQTATRDRWDALRIVVDPWKRNPNGHVVVACPTPTYEKFHGILNWTEITLRRLARVTDRQIVTRDKESKRSLQADLDGAHCLIAHGSMTAVEAVICGCPVIVHPDSAASLMGVTELEQIEKLRYPERDQWLWSLANSQFNEQELVDGTLWRMLE